MLERRHVVRCGRCGRCAALHSTHSSKLELILRCHSESLPRIAAPVQPDNPPSHTSAAFGIITFFFIAFFSCNRCCCKNICPAVTACVLGILQAIGCFVVAASWHKTIASACDLVACTNSTGFTSNGGIIAAGIGGALALIGGILAAVAGCRRRREVNFLVLGGGGGGSSVTVSTSSSSGYMAGGYAPGQSPGWDVPNHSVNAGGHDGEDRKGLMQDFA